MRFKTTYNQAMHRTEIKGVSVSARMYRLVGMRIGKFLERQLKKVFAED